MRIQCKVFTTGTTWVAKWNHFRAYDSGPTSSALRAAQKLALHIAGVSRLLPADETEAYDLLCREAISVDSIGTHHDEEIFQIEY